MKSKYNSISLPGQRSITSTFLSISSNPKRFPGDVKVKTPKMGTNLSLSDFLNQKLHRSCVLPNSLKDKESLISPIVAHGAGMDSNEVSKDPEKGVEADKFPLEFVLEQFKCTSNIEDPFSVSVNEEVGSSNVSELLESRKRKNPQSLITIGGDPKTPRLKSKQEREERFIQEKKPRQLFNHYGNGKGWWDGDMEGVDNEEVGSVETWEGVGSATIGGLEWH